MFELLSQGDREIIDEYFNRFVTESKNVNTLITEEVYENDVLQLNLEEARAFFNQTVVIFLENNLHDEYFFKALVKKFYFCRRWRKSIRLENAFKHRYFADD